MREPFSSRKLFRVFANEHMRLAQGFKEPKKLDADQTALDMDALCLGIFTVSHLDQRGTCTFEIDVTDDQGSPIPLADIARELNSRYASVVPSVHGDTIAAAGRHIQSVARGISLASGATNQMVARPGYPRGQAR